MINQDLLCYLCCILNHSDDIILDPCVVLRHAVTITLLVSNPGHLRLLLDDISVTHVCLSEGN